MYGPTTPFPPSPPPPFQWKAVIDVCLNGPFYATQAAIPGMLERGWGRIINTGSMHALVASPFKSAYNAGMWGGKR